MYRIAICEDEPLTAQENETMLCRILEARRFRRDIDFSITSFSAPKPLLTSLQKQPSALRLLLLDIVLARENGVELAARLRELNVECFPIETTYNPQASLFGTLHGHKVWHKHNENLIYG